MYTCFFILFTSPPPHPPTDPPPPFLPPIFSFFRSESFKLYVYKNNNKIIKKKKKKKKLRCFVSSSQPWFPDGSCPVTCCTHLHFNHTNLNSGWPRLLVGCLLARKSSQYPMLVSPWSCHMTWSWPQRLMRENYPLIKITLGFQLSRRSMHEHIHIYSAASS